MKTSLQTLIFALGLIVFTACGGGGGSSDSTESVTATGSMSGSAEITTEEGTTQEEAVPNEPIPLPAPDTKTRALQIIVAYAQSNGTSIIPVAQTYAYAGVIGIGNDNVNDFNAVISGLAPEEVDTTEELQVLLNAMGESSAPLAPIPPNPFDPGVVIPGLPTGPVIPDTPTFDPVVPETPGLPTGPPIPETPTLNTGVPVFDAVPADFTLIPIGG